MASDLLLLVQVMTRLQLAQHARLLGRQERGPHRICHLPWTRTSCQFDREWFLPRFDLRLAAKASGLLFFNHRRGVSLLLSLTPPRHLQTHCFSSCACTCSLRPPCNIPHHRIQSRLSVQYQKTLQKLAASTIAGDHNSRLELQRIDSTLDAGRPRGCRMALDLTTSWASAPEPLQGTAMPPWRHVCLCPATQPDEIVAASI